MPQIGWWFLFYSWIGNLLVGRVVHIQSKVFIKFLPVITANRSEGNQERGAGAQEPNTLVDGCLLPRLLV